MAQQELRQVERKYRRIKRQMRREQKHTPLRIALILLAALAVLSVWIGTLPYPKPDLPDALRVCFLDVGQGDAALIQTPEHAVLIDAGDFDHGYPVVQMLKALGVKHLDAAVCSHPHADHMGGMKTVLTCIPTDTLYLPEIPAQLSPTEPFFTELLDTAANQNTVLRSPACHETAVLDGSILEFLYTDFSAFENLNNCSLGCIVTCGDIRFYLAGDQEQESEQAMLDAGLISSVSVLKVSHHGSSSSTSEAFLHAAKPEYAVISCAAMNDYGHPSARVLRRLADAGCEIFRTDLNGSVLFATDGKTLRTVTNAVTAG